MTCWFLPHNSDQSSPYRRASPPPQVLTERRAGLPGLYNSLPQLSFTHDSVHMSMRLSQEPSSISFKPGHTCTQAEQESKNEGIPSHSVAEPRVSEQSVPPPSLLQYKRTPLASQILTIILIYIQIKKGRGDSNKKRPLIK